jgi:hypothetical protein
MPAAEEQVIGDEKMQFDMPLEVANPEMPPPLNGFSE